MEVFGLFCCRFNENLQNEKSRKQRWKTNLPNDWITKNRYDQCIVDARMKKKINQVKWMWKINNFPLISMRNRMNIIIQILWEIATTAWFEYELFRENIAFECRKKGTVTKIILSLKHTTNERRKKKKIIHEISEKEKEEELKSTLHDTNISSNRSSKSNSNSINTNIHKKTCVKWFSKVEMNGCWTVFKRTRLAFLTTGNVSKSCDSIFVARVKMSF